MLLFEALGNRIGKTAAAGKDPSKVAGVVKDILRKRCDVNVPAVKECLQFLKGDDGIDIRLNALKLRLCLLGRAGSDEYDFRFFLMVPNVFGDGRHGGKVVGNIGDQGRESRLDVTNKGRTAGRGQESLFRELL